ncbi:MBL fold metallo-hydrolase [Pseudovibrio sp. Ad37]|uniref:MBL fold metallo-hydrolase n=1 Tax=Pseudovibrio sp. Ad37 TaxID=989422 RepID=UPI0007AED217|nr:MBL fold metallo-hydrolase [Pseudovibrio sp. Ad37]KZL26608.1 metal-dependent hydrolase [Pseudovibrio sp. Ad37]
MRSIEFTVVIFVLVGVFMTACAATQKDHKQGSLNFKDGAFRNNSLVETHSFWEVAWAGLTSDTERAKWPKWVETITDPSPQDRVNSKDARVTFINHSTFLIQINGFNILTDPVFSERTSPISFAGPKRVHKPGIALEDLPEIDVIIVSHDHYDHLDLKSINQLIKRDNPKIYTGLGVGSRLASSDNINELDWLDSAQVSDDFKLWFLEVQHFSGRTLTDRNSTLWGGFLMQIGGKNIYFGGDSGYANHFKRTYEQFGPVDLAFLPIGAYAPRHLFKPVHLDPFEAVKAHMDLRAKQSIGMHYGTFQLSAEARVEPVELLEQAKREAQLSPSSFITLNVGQPLDMIGVGSSD